MGICSDERNKKYTLVNRDLDELSKSFCKIYYYFDDHCFKGDGFFMTTEFDFSLNFLITSYYFISEKLLGKNIYLKIHNQKMSIILPLDNNLRLIKFFKNNLNMTMIQIKKEDLLIDQNVIYLKYDSLIMPTYNSGDLLDIFTFQCSDEGTKLFNIGKLINKKNEKEFEHNIPIDSISSCSPIFDFINKSVIGIICDDNLKNVGVFISVILDNIRKIYESKNREENIDINNCEDYLLNKKYKENNNYIIAIFDINIYNLYSNVRIINSYNEYYKNLNNEKIAFYEDYVNEEEIKKCEIYIDNKKIPFSYFYIFNKIGKYIITYSFKNKLKKLNHMFLGCKRLLSINLSNFNTDEALYMNSLLKGCSSLEEINLSNIYTYNVKNISSLFYGCSSLKEVDLSNFNTYNVKDMSCLFYGCSSLKKIDLSNFNTHNVTEMLRMFQGCSSLISLDLSSFSTYSFNHLKVALMFKDCKSLLNVDLSNLNVEDIDYGLYCMFEGCQSALFINMYKKNENLIIKYLEELKKNQNQN